MGGDLRVLHIADFDAPYPGAFIGQLRMLDDELRARGARPTAFAFPVHAADREWCAELVRDGFDVYRLPRGRPRGDRAIAAAIEQIASDAGATVVHTHFGSYDMSTARAVRRLRARGARRLAQVWHYRTALECDVDQRVLGRRVKDYLKFVRAGAGVDCCVAVTEALAVEVAARGMGDRAQAVVAGTDTDTFRPIGSAARQHLRRKLGIADDEIFVLHMGWHWHRKGGDLLAAAARELEARGYGRLVFCSIGAPVDLLLAPVRLLVPTDQVHELHQASDVFVSASRSEGFGNGLVEALACERVAVAALVDGQREIFAGLEAGCVPVPPGDAIALADGIERLLRVREQWGALGATNRAHIVANNSMRRWARNMADIYAELCPLQLRARGADDGGGHLHRQACDPPYDPRTGAHPRAHRHADGRRGRAPRR